MTLPRIIDDTASRLLIAEHAEELGETLMPRAWRWMAEQAKWPQFNAGWWPEDYEHYPACHRLSFYDEDHNVFWVRSMHECERVLAEILEKRERENETGIL